VSWEVLALRYGTLAATKAGLYCNWHIYGEPDAAQELAYYFYVLRDNDRVALVDTGFSVASGQRRGRGCLVDPREAVARLGISPPDVDDVLITHLHYDHVGNVEGWPRARVHVPAAELDFWASPMAGEPQFAAHVDPEPLAWLAREDRAGRVTRYAGPAEPIDGVRALAVGGHSPGQHVLLVEARSGPVLLASDAVHLYEELEHGRPFAIFVDLMRMYEGYGLVRQIAEEHGALVVPGHDPLTAERFEAVDRDRLVVRIA
jgi:glyoxylase-like metal-dependent hydrolase (beta-lactamase superfamily II)